MNVAVLSLVRERLSDVQASFASLAENAGCDYRHYVLSQGGTDGTGQWLIDSHDSHFLFTLNENIGIARGLNVLLAAALSPNLQPYDVIVKFDPDVSVNRPGTLAAATYCALKGNMVCSPRVRGLNHPPTPTGHRTYIPAESGPVHEVTEMSMVGGCFLAAPASLYENWRYPEDLPKWGGDDDAVCAHARTLGMAVGYLEGYDVTHDTNRHHAEHPSYFQRTLAEGKPAL